MSFPYKAGDYVIIRDVCEDDIPVRKLFKYQVASVGGNGDFLVYTSEGGWPMNAGQLDNFPDVPLGTYVWWFHKSAFESLCHEVIRIDTVD